jgi:gliding motility-associated-like protein
VYTQSGTYTDTLTTLNGCDSIVSLNLTITELPIVTAESVSASCELPNGTATANATGGSGNYSYSWSNGATGSFITGLASGSYSVIATDQNGCASSIQVTVLCDSTIAICELSTPNAFTPDGDGINDKFCPLTNCTLEDYEFSIYNRWGELIFKTSNQTDKWDGKFKGSACSVGVYVYAISYKFPSQQTKNAYGNITLLR